MKKRLLSIFILIAYCAVLIRVMVFKVVPIIKSGQVTLDFGGTNGSEQANFVPFKTILPYLMGDKGLTIALLNLGGNIALLVPIGFLVSLLYRNMTWKKALVLGAIAGLSIEITQTILDVGIFDIDDVILNALGVVIGYLAFILLVGWVRNRKFIHIFIAALLVVAATSASFYIIYPHGEQQPVRVEQERAVPKTGDLCGGTGGTGEIVSQENSTITIKSKAGVIQTIKLTDQTTIRTSAGSASESNLKIGDRVTVVIDETETATAVLVCNIE